MMVREVFSSPECERHTVADDPDIVSQISRVRSGLKIHYRIGRIQFVCSLVLGFYVPFNLLLVIHDSQLALKRQEKMHLNNVVC